MEVGGGFQYWRCGMNTIPVITIWSLDRLHCPKHGDGWPFANCGCMDWNAALFVTPPDDADSYDPDYADYTIIDDPSYCAVLQDVTDEAWLRGCRKVCIDGRVIALRSSARRRKLAAERKERELKERRERRSKSIRYGISRALVRRIISAPSSSDIRMFFRRWREVSGYGPKDETLRSILAPGKESLVRSTLALAERHNWLHGRRHDTKAFNKYSDVVYVDTPLGQASFHVMPGLYSTLPVYGGEWNGLHNTPAILASLCESPLDSQGS
jgi:hypothetical protein